MARFGGGTFASTTQNPPDDNCVVHHEDEPVRAGAVGLGTWSVSFAYIGWEDPNHATIIENLYTLTIQPASGAAEVAMTIRLPASQDRSANSATDVRQHAGAGALTVKRWVLGPCEDRAAGSSPLGSG
jgi:hypothetical protein